MFNWLKKILGIGPSVPAAIEAAIPTPEEKPAPKAVKKTTTKKPATKKSGKADLSSMSKNELLAHAKANGVKANASMNKAAILKAIKNG